MGARLKADHLAKLKATTAQAATEEKLAKGIGGDPAWKSKATPLPADGGEPGQVFLAEVKAIGAAVKAKDVDAAAKAGGGWNEMVFGATEDGKPVPLATRQLALRVQSPRIIVDARVLGGYVNGDQAVLVIEGTNGAGNTLEGPLVMSKSPCGGGALAEERPLRADRDPEGLLERTRHADQDRGPRAELGLVEPLSHGQLDAGLERLASRRGPAEPGRRVERGAAGGEDGLSPVGVALRASAAHLRGDGEPPADGSGQLQRHDHVVAHAIAEVVRGCVLV